MRQDCCENAIWKIGPNKDGSIPIHEFDNTKETQFDIDGYVFDPEYHEEDNDEGNESFAVIFRLVKRIGNKNEDVLYLRLENHQNGYYSHGFTFRGNITINGSV